MELVWVPFWLAVIVAIIISIIGIVKGNLKIGIVNLLLSIIMPIWGFIFALHRDWVVTKESELAFFFKQLSLLNVEAILLLIGYIALILVTIYSIIKLNRRKNV